MVCAESGDRRRDAILSVAGWRGGHDLVFCDDKPGGGVDSLYPIAFRG